MTALAKFTDLIGKSKPGTVAEVIQQNFQVNKKHNFHDCSVLSPTNLIFYISTALSFLKHIHRSHIQFSVNRAGPSKHDKYKHQYGVKRKIKSDFLDSKMSVQQYFDNNFP